MTRLHLPIGGVEDSATEAVSCLIHAEEHSISLIRVISHILAGPRKISSPNGPQEKRLGEGCRQDVSVEAALVHLPSSTLLCSVREKLGPPRGPTWDPACCLPGVSAEGDRKQTCCHRLLSCRRLPLSRMKRAEELRDSLGSHTGLCSNSSYGRTELEIAYTQLTWSVSIN